jgi:hypothetical protein
MGGGDLHERSRGRDLVSPEDGVTLAGEKRERDHVPRSLQPNWSWWTNRRVLPLELVEAKRMQEQQMGKRGEVREDHVWMAMMKLFLLGD